MDQLKGLRSFVDMKVPTESEIKDFNNTNFFSDNNDCNMCEQSKHMIHSAYAHYSPEEFKNFLLKLVRNKQPGIDMHDSSVGSYVTIWKPIELHRTLDFDDTPKYFLNEIHAFSYYISYMIEQYIPMRTGIHSCCQDPKYRGAFNKQCIQAVRNCTDIHELTDTILNMEIL